MNNDKQKLNNVVCAICHKTRQAHYDMIYCYAATRHVDHNDTTYVFPIKDFKFSPLKGA